MLDDRLKLLSSFADGAIAPSALAGLADRDLQALAQLGAAALAGQRWEQARRVFDALAVLAPDDHRHLLHLAYACAGAKDVDATCAAVEQLVDSERPVPSEDVARALLLRAELVAAVDRARAERDLVAVRVLAQHNDGARRVLEGGA